MADKLPSSKELAKIASDKRVSSKKRRSALVALRESASPLARDIFLEVIKSEDNQNLRESAIKGLGVVGSDEDLKLLESLQKTQIPYIPSKRWIKQPKFPPIIAAVTLPNFQPVAISGVGPSALRP